MTRLLRSIPATALLVVALAFAALMLVPAALGYERYVVLTGSMAGTHDPGSVVYNKPAPVEDLRAGDVITYAPPAGKSAHELITHRIVKIDVTRDGRRVLHTKGDANESPDPWSFTLERGSVPRVEAGVPHVGRALVAMSDRETRMLLIGVPAAAIALFVLFGLVRDARAEARGPAAPAAEWTRL